MNHSKHGSFKECNEILSLGEANQEKFKYDMKQ